MLQIHFGILIRYFFFFVFVFLIAWPTTICNILESHFSRNKSNMHPHLAQMRPIELDISTCTVERESRRKKESNKNNNNMAQSMAPFPIESNVSLYLSLTFGSVQYA